MLLRSMMTGSNYPCVYSLRGAAKDDVMPCLFFCAPGARPAEPGVTMVLLQYNVLTDHASIWSVPVVTMSGCTMLRVAQGLAGLA
jgi:hypothetical protein